MILVFESLASRRSTHGQTCKEIIQNRMINMAVSISKELLVLMQVPPSLCGPEVSLDLEKPGVVPAPVAPPLLVEFVHRLRNGGCESDSELTTRNPLEASL